MSYFIKVFIKNDIKDITKKLKIFNFKEKKNK